MQIQKDEIRNKIMEAALEEFLVAGYSQSSLRNIASGAGITVGNIYSYFSSKEQLFESLVSGTVEQLHGLIFIEVSPEDPVSSTGIAHITHAIAEVFMNNRMQFLILMDGSAGSKYANIKERLIEMVCRRIHDELIPKLHINKVDPLLAESMSVAIIEGIINIFRKCGDDNQRLERLLSQFLTVIFGDIIKRL